MLVGSPLSHWVPLAALAVLAAFDLMAQYLAAATDLPHWLHLSYDVIDFLQLLVDPVSHECLHITRHVHCCTYNTIIGAYIFL